MRFARAAAVMTAARVVPFLPSHRNPRTHGNAERVTAERPKEVSPCPVLVEVPEGLLPQEIQRREHRAQSVVTTDGTGHTQTADGNRVELTWNDGRLNVNDNWDDNRNSNVWTSSVRHSLLSQPKHRPYARVVSATHPSQT
jgi:hypothetical protein